MHKILVIEDSKLFRTRIMNILHDGGYKNIVGIESYKSIKNNIHENLKDVDLIITDIGLPDVNGIDLIGILKENGRYSHIPVVFVSALGDMNTIKNALKVGATDYIIKPFDNGLLLDRVNRILFKPRYFNKKTTEEMEKIKVNACLEYERAIRGGHPFSIIHACVNPGNAHEIFVSTRKLLRKIDSVYLVDDRLIVMMPLTGSNGVDVVFKKMNSSMETINGQLLEVTILTYNDGIERKIDEFFDLLAVDEEGTASKNCLHN